MSEEIHMGRHKNPVYDITLSYEKWRNQNE